MTNQTLEPLSDNERQALLVEYQACQHDNNASGSSYWTLTGIFIGFSSVLLGGLVYGLLQNNELLQTLLLEVKLSPQILALLVIAIVVGGVVIAILCFLRRWLRRVGFLQQINFERMRDIERELGMWKSWRVHGVDHWTSNRFDNSVLPNDSARLLEYRDVNFWQHWRNRARYEQSSRWHYDGIFGGLIFLWSFVVLSVLFLTLVRFSPLAFSLILAFVLAVGLAFVLAVGLAFLLIRLSRTERV